MKKEQVEPFVCSILSNAVCKKPAGIIMEMEPESQQVHTMDADRLQWLWNEVDVLHEKINDLPVRTKTM
jgi:hypothetical protein